MKEIAITALFIVYSIVSVFIMGWAILYPLMIGVKDFPTWSVWIVYPLTILIMASQKKVLDWFFNDKTGLNK